MSCARLPMRRRRLIAVLDHLMGDESLLLMFAAEKGIAAETLVAAHARLTRPAIGRQTL